MNDKKQNEKQAIEEMAKILRFEDCIDVGRTECRKFDDCNVCKATRLYNAGYRKQSENTVEIETVKKWLYEMAINNVGCYLEGDFATACEQIISRLDGLKRFAEEMKGGAE